MMAARMAQVYPGIDDPKKKKEVAKKFTELGRFVGADLAGKQYSPPFDTSRRAARAARSA